MATPVQALFSRRLKLLREKNELTMVELADEIGMSQATISEWEKGNKFPRSGALQQLANFFSVPIDYLFKEKTFLQVDTVDIPFYPSMSEGLSTIDGINYDNVEYIKIPTYFLGSHEKCGDMISFKVSTNSMNLVFTAGATVIAKITERENLENEDIIIYRFNNNFGVGRFRNNKLKEVIVLSPESTSKSYFDIVIPFASQNKLEIIAKVIWYGVSI